MTPRITDGYVLGVLAAKTGLEEWAARKVPPEEAETFLRGRRNAQEVQWRDLAAELHAACRECDPWTVINQIRRHGGEDALAGAFAALYEYLSDQLHQEAANAESGTDGA